MAELVDLDRELHERTVAHLRASLSTPKVLAIPEETRDTILAGLDRFLGSTLDGNALLLDWLLREHKIEIDALKAEVAGLRQANGVMGPVLDAACRVAVGAPVKTSIDDSPLEPMPTPLEEAEAMRRVNEMLDEVGEKPLTPAESAGSIDASPEHVEDKPSESPDRAPTGFQKHQLVLNPAPIDTTPPEPYKPEGPVSDAEKKRIMGLIGNQRSERLTGAQYVDVVLRRMKKQTVTQIAAAIGLQPANCGAYLRSADRHVTNLAAHPREEWREAYLEALKESIDSARGAA